MADETSQCESLARTVGRSVSMLCTTKKKWVGRLLICCRHLLLNSHHCAREPRAVKQRRSFWRARAKSQQNISPNLVISPWDYISYIFIFLVSSSCLSHQHLTAHSTPARTVFSSFPLNYPNETPSNFIFHLTSFLSVVYSLYNFNKKKSSNLILIPFIPFKSHR